MVQREFLVFFLFRLTHVRNNFSKFYLQKNLLNTFPAISSFIKQLKVMNSFSYPDSNGFGGFGTFLSGLTIFTLGLYFITSSDSGSLVVDILASNGATEHHWIQRVFWAVTEGGTAYYSKLLLVFQYAFVTKTLFSTVQHAFSAILTHANILGVACALLVAGGDAALRSVQSASIIFGVPFNLFLFIMCLTIVQMCNAIEKEQNGEKPDPSLMLPTKEQSWSMPLFGGIFNIFESLFSLFIFVEKSRKEKGMHFPSSKQGIKFVGALFLPFVPLYAIYNSTVMNPKQVHKTGHILLTFFYASCYIGWIVLFCLGTVNKGFVAFGWLLFLLNASILTSVRAKFRNALGYPGNVVADFVASSILYPQCLSQMMLELESENVSTFVAARHDD